MDRFGMSDLRRLSGANNGPRVSIWMPTHISGADGQQDALRLKNLADQAEQMLADGWLRAPVARDLLEPVRDVPSDNAFWESRSLGLALFLDHESLRRFRVPVRLDELAFVDRRFYVKPLLSLLNSSERFFILALSQKNVRLLEATRYDVDAIEVPGLPQRMDEALNLDVGKPGVQSHFAMKGGKGKQTSVFHGHGGARQSHKDDLNQFFHLIDEALVPVLREEHAPLVLAGVDYLLPIFRKGCRYPHVAAPELVGNVDHWSTSRIHEKVWPLVEPIFLDAREKAAAKYRRLAGTGKTSDDIRQVLPAAVEGRVETLFVASDQQVWGAHHPPNNSVDLHDAYQRGDTDVLDAAAVQTLLNRGTVYTLPRTQLPAPEPVAAVYRF